MFNKRAQVKETSYIIHHVSAEQFLPELYDLWNDLLERILEHGNDVFGILEHLKVSKAKKDLESKHDKHGAILLYKAIVERVMSMQLDKDKDHAIELSKGAKENAPRSHLIQVLSTLDAGSKETGKDLDTFPELIEEFQIKRFTENSKHVLGLLDAIFAIKSRILQQIKLEAEAAKALAFSSHRQFAAHLKPRKVESMRFVMLCGPKDLDFVLMLFKQLQDNFDCFLFLNVSSSQSTSEMKAELMKKLLSEDSVNALRKPVLISHLQSHLREKKTIKLNSSLVFRDIVCLPHRLVTTEELHGICSSSAGVVLLQIPLFLSRLKTIFPKEMLKSTSLKSNSLLKLLDEISWLQPEVFIYLFEFFEKTLRHFPCASSEMQLEVANYFLSNIYTSNWALEEQRWKSAAAVVQQIYGAGACDKTFLGTDTDLEIQLVLGTANTGVAGKPREDTTGSQQ